MILSLALASALLQQDRFKVLQPDFRTLTLTSIDNASAGLMLEAQLTKLDPPKRAPLNKLVFEYITAGYARLDAKDDFHLRVRVFTQYRPSNGDPTDLVAQMLMRLWDFNRWRLGVDHSPAIHQKAVDVYLCAGGDPGAEQRVLEDPLEPTPDGRPSRVNNIYIYAVQNIPNALEFAREVAHEYGHASWPPIGGYKEPEDWASGDMGERVFMTWVMQGMEAKKLGPQDAMNATLTDLQQYYAERVLPDMKRVGTKMPQAGVLKGDDKGAYAELMGLTSYAAAILPYKVFGRSLMLNRDRTALGLYNAVFEACSEVDDWNLTVPQGMEGLALWVPLKSGTVTGAKELRREGDWLKIQPTSANVTVHNAKTSSSP